MCIHTHTQNVFEDNKCMNTKYQHLHATHLVSVSFISCTSWPCSFTSLSNCSVLASVEHRSSFSISNCLCRSYIQNRCHYINIRGVIMFVCVWLMYLCLCVCACGMCAHRSCTVHTYIQVTSTQYSMHIHTHYISTPLTVTGRWHTPLLVFFSLLLI